MNCILSLIQTSKKTKVIIFCPFLPLATTRQFPIFLAAGLQSAAALGTAFQGGDGGSRPISNCFEY